MHRQVCTGTTKLFEPLRENQSGYPSPGDSFPRLHSSLANSYSQLPFPLVSPSPSLQVLFIVLQVPCLTLPRAYN